MTQMDEELKRDLNDIFEPLRHVEQRNPQHATAGRKQFLSKADALFIEATPILPVSMTPFQRLNGWIAGILNPLYRKERVNMFSILTALLVTVTLLFGGAGATVLAAQDSLPTQVLYPVKEFSEDMRLSLASQPESRISLLLNYADQRVDEIAALLAKGEPVPEKVMQRFQKQMASAYQIAAGLDEDRMQKTMALIKLRARNQERIMTMVQPESPGVGATT